MFFIMPSLFGVGFQVPDLVVPATVRGGSKVLGQLVAFDLANSDAATTDNAMDGGDNSGFGNVIATRSNAIEEATGIFGVIEGPGEGSQASAGNTVADDRLAAVRMYGVTRALVLRASGSYAKHDPLYSDQSVAPTAMTIAPATVGEVHKQLATCLAVVTTPTTATLASVWFFGGLPFGIASNVGT